MNQDTRTEGQVGRHGTAVVNGPEDDVLDWGSVNWPEAEDRVRRLRQRIFTASREGDLAKVRNLQKLMLRSRANALVSVRRVTERNAGRKTAGIDGTVVVTASGKAFLADSVQHHDTSHKPKPLKRVYISKANGKKRPLGIPVIFDRALQAHVVNALEPEWEARFEPKSYGFRPGRGCHDAIQCIFTAARGKSARRCWALDADLAAAFDRIDHSHLLSALGTFPARELIERWLKAGVVEQGHFAPTEEGTPQGGVISPVLLNVALHGLEEAAGVRYHHSVSQAGATMADSPVVVRYADDRVTRTQGGIDVEDRTRQVVLCQRWGLAPRDRPAGGGLKPPQAASVKSRGGERCGKGAPRVRQVRAEKANESKPLMTCRKRIDDIETGRESFFRDEPGGYLPTAQAVSGIKAARAQFRLWCGTCEPVAPIPIWPFTWACAATRPTRGRTPSRRNGKGQSTDAEHRDGPTRSSDEGPVMGLERRGRVIRTRLVVNHRWVG
jgi:RNA-directed DNA polymerase